MNKILPLNFKNHPKYESVIAEVLRGEFDPVLMNKALQNTQDASKAQAHYVLLKLQSKT